MKTTKTLIAGLALGLSLGAASLTVAHGSFDGPRGGHMMGPGYMTGERYANPQLSTEQQQEVEAIEKKYEKELASKEAAIRDKGAELDKALADKSTTVAEARELRSEVFALEQEYWQLRRQVNREISDKIGTGYRGGPGWGPENCPWHDDQYGHMRGQGGRHHGGRGMMGYGMGPGYPGGRYCQW